MGNNSDVNIDIADLFVVVKMAVEQKPRLGFPVDAFIASLAKVGITCTIREKLTPEQRTSILKASEEYSENFRKRQKAKDEFRYRAAKKL